MVSYFIGVYIINRTLHGRLEIRNFSSRVENISTLEEKFRISAQPCNILYIFNNYSTSACWIWVGFNHLISNKRYCFIKNAHKNWEFFLTPFVRTTDFQLSADAYSYHMFIIWRAWYSGSYTMMAKPIRALELHYPLIQFLINCIFFFSYLQTSLIPHNRLNKLNKHQTLGTLVSYFVMYLNIATQTSLYANYENHFENYFWWNSYKYTHYSLVKTAIAKKHLWVFWHFFLRCSKKIWKTYVAI